MIYEPDDQQSVSQSVSQSADFGDYDDDYSDDDHAASLAYNALVIDDPVDLAL